MRRVKRVAALQLFLQRTPRKAERRCTDAGAEDIQGAHCDLEPFTRLAEQVDHRADLFALGCVLFEMLTGRPPHTGTVYEAVLIDICTKNAPDIRSLEPGVPDAVDAMAEVTTGARFGLASSLEGPRWQL